MSGEGVLEGWRAQRARDLDALCQRLGLPLGQMVEVRLVQGPSTRGVLRLADEALWIEGRRDHAALQIGAMTFGMGDIESVLRVAAE